MKVNKTSTGTIVAAALALVSLVACSSETFSGKAANKDETSKDSGTAEQPTEVTGAFLCGHVANKSSFGAQNDESAVGCALPSTVDAGEKVSWKAYTTTDGVSPSYPLEAGDVRKVDDPSKKWAKVFILPTIRMPEVMVTLIGECGASKGSTWFKKIAGDTPKTFRLMGDPAFNFSTAWIPAGGVIGDQVLKTSVNPEDFCNYNGGNLSPSLGLSPIVTQDPVKKYCNFPVINAISSLFSGKDTICDSKSFSSPTEPVELGPGKGCVRKWPVWSFESKYLVAANSGTPRIESDYVLTGSGPSQPYCYLLRGDFLVNGAIQKGTLAMPVAATYGDLKGTYLTLERLKAVLPEHVCTD